MVNIPKLIMVLVLGCVLVPLAVIIRVISIMVEGLTYGKERTDRGWAYDINQIYARSNGGWR